MENPLPFLLAAWSQKSDLPEDFCGSQFVCGRGQCLRPRIFLEAGQKQSVSAGFPPGLFLKGGLQERGRFSHPEPPGLFLRFFLRANQRQPPHQKDCPARNEPRANPEERKNPAEDSLPEEKARKSCDFFARSFFSFHADFKCDQIIMSTVPGNFCCGAVKKSA